MVEHLCTRCKKRASAARRRSDGQESRKGVYLLLQCNNIRALLHRYEINITFRIVVKFLLVREAADTSRFLKECSRLFRVPKSLKSGDTVNMYCFPF